MAVLIVGYGAVRSRSSLTHPSTSRTCPTARVMTVPPGGRDATPGSRRHHRPLRRSARRRRWGCRSPLLLDGDADGDAVERDGLQDRQHLFCPRRQLDLRRLGARELGGVLAIEDHRRAQRTLLGDVHHTGEVDAPPAQRLLQAVFLGEGVGVARRLRELRLGDRLHGDPWWLRGGCWVSGRVRYGGRSIGRRSWSAGPCARGFSTRRAAP